MSIFSKLFDWVGRLFSKIWKAFKKALPYILVAAALWVGFVGALPLTWLGLSTIIPAGWMSSLLFLGTSYLLAPEETTAVISSAAAAVGDSVTAVVSAAGEVAEATGDALGSTLSAFMESSGLLWIVIAVGGWMLLKDGNSAASKSERVVVDLDVERNKRNSSKYSNGGHVNAISNK